MLTPEEIKVRATSPRAALLVSIEKWTDCARLSPEELRKLNNDVLKCSHCGLCYWHGPCHKRPKGDCVLKDGGNTCCEEWRKAMNMIWDYQRNKVDVSQVYAAFWSMVARLDAELAKLPEEKKRELRHGDYGWAYNKQWIAEYNFLRCCIQITYKRPDSSPTQSDIKYLLAASDYEYWGNIDDLAAMQEDVERFEFERDNSLSIINACVCSNGTLVIDQRNFNITNAKEYILKLRQMVAYAERKQLCKENKK